MERDYIKFLQCAERAINERARYEKTKRTYAPGIMLTRSERDVLDEIGRYPGIGIRGIAKNKGVTEGAVSQTVKRLVHMALIEKKVSDESEAKVCLSLTSTGQMCYENSKKEHDKSFEEWCDILDKLTDSEFECLCNFFSQFEQKYARHNTFPL